MSGVSKVSTSAKPRVDKMIALGRSGLNYSRRFVSRSEVRRVRATFEPDAKCFKWAAQCIHSLCKQNKQPKVSAHLAPAPLSSALSSHKFCGWNWSEWTAAGNVPSRVSCQVSWLTRGFAEHQIAYSRQRKQACWCARRPHRCSLPGRAHHHSHSRHRVTQQPCAFLRCRGKTALV